MYLFFIFVRIREMDLIIGLYDYEDIKLRTGKGGIYYFLNSLRRFNKTCLVSVFCKNRNLSQEFYSFCKLKKATIYFHDFNDDIKKKRYKIFKDYTNKLKNINRIIISDMNDIIFQKDPFSININSNKICISQESNRILNEFNIRSTIIRSAIYDVLNKININISFDKEDLICNNGFIIGNLDQIQSLLDKIDKYQSSYGYDLDDKALFNIIIYTDKESYYLDGNNNILNLKELNFKLIQKDNQGFLLNKEKKIYSVIHQIDNLNHSDFKYILTIANRIY